MAKFAFVFPGQGSQKAGMLSNLYENYSLVRETFEQATDELGFDLWDVIQNDSAKLNQTEYTQPAILTASVAIWRLWKEASKVNPTVMAGHSLGEYSALVCAGAIEFTDAVTLVSARGRLMQKAIPVGQGAMAAILGLDDAKVKEACDMVAKGEVVVPANYNCPGQVVIAGQSDAVDRAIAKAKELGAKLATKLAVSVPSHSELMRQAAEKFKIYIDDIEIKKAKVPVLHNVDFSEQTNPKVIKEKLIQQLYMPVHWTKTIEKIHSMGVTAFVECGPGKVLTGLDRRIVKGMDNFTLNDEASLKQVIGWIKECH